MYKRVMLKLSGEAMGGNGEPFDFDLMRETARQLIQAVELGVEIGVVIGGGNIWRGRSAGCMDRNKADQMGMLATMINALALQDTLLQLNAKCSVLTAIEMPRVAQTFTSCRADELLKQKQIVLFACGSGHPFFSTDTAAALRAAEIGAQVLLLAKNVDGIYSADPKTDKKAMRYERLTTKQVIEQGLKATDLTAITLCAEQGVAIHVFGLKEENAIVRVMRGEKIGTIISDAV